MAIRVCLIVVALSGVFLAGYVVWGGPFDSLCNPESCAGWFAGMRPTAWAVAIGLLVVDLLLPVPATGVMAALGAVYGVVLGAVIGTVGSMLAGLAGYGLARHYGLRVARALASAEEQDRFRCLFDRWGGVAIILSRMLPILPEVITVLAGLARMHAGRFLAALMLGTLPTAILYAWIGHLSTDHPGAGLILAVALPLAAWPLVTIAFKDRGAGGDGTGDRTYADGSRER